MDAAVIGLACAVALLALLVYRLGRHQQRLAAAIDDLARTGRPGRPSPPPRVPLVDQPAPPLVGDGADGAPVSVRWAGAPPTVVAFLTSACTTCRPFWEQLTADRRPGGAPTVVVTPDAAAESRRAVADLAGDRLPVVMSTAAWLDYAAAGAPWFAVVAGGRVVAEGRPGAWEDLEAMVTGASPRLGH